MAHYTRQKNVEVEVEERALSPTSEALSESGGGAVSFISPGFKYRVKSTSLLSGRTCLEKILATTVLILVIFCFLVTMIAINVRKQTNINMYLSHNAGDNRSEAVCLSADCVTAAASILASLDLTVNPCQDFYQYACGGWERANPIPDGKSSWSTFGKLWQDNQQVLRNILETPPSQQEGGCDACSKARLYYAACLDKNDTLELLQGQPLLEILSDFYWNITDFDGGTQMDNFSFQHVMQEVQHGFNVGGFFVWNVGEDDKNSSRHVLQIDQGGLTLNSRDYYINKTEDDPVIAALLQVMVETSLLLYQDKKNYTDIPDIIKNDVRNQMLEVIQFEIKLAEFATPSSQQRDEERRYHKFSLQKLQNISDFIDWQEYFRYAFLPVSRKIKPTETIIVYSPEYLTNISELVKEKLMTIEGKNMLNNYLMWQIIRNFNGALSKKYLDVDKILKKAMMGTDIHEERWRLCVSDVDNVLGFALGAMFVNKTFDGHSKPEAEAMIKEVTSAFISGLHAADWMDNKTKLLAEKKAEKITNMIGYPEYIVNNTGLNDKYKKLEINQDYFANNIRFNKWGLEENLVKLDKEVEKDKWGMTPPTINAYYTPTKNQIVFPAGILQMPFFSLKNPRSLNFGAMGVIMGHELSHAFDDQGREYDANGNMRGWWQNKTLEEYQKRVKCIEDQYGNFTVNQDVVNGRQTLGENIADNGGLKASYTAYQSWLSTNPRREQELLPGLNLTNNQLFFLSFSQVWCSQSTPQAEHLSLLEDAHSPPRWRVLGTLANSEFFSAAFNCPKGSRMNPTEKCTVW